MNKRPDGLIGTGVFATDEEQAIAKDLAAKAARTPVILLFGQHDLSGEARERMYETVHGFALAHGLPEIPGFYGMDEKGEFIRQDFEGEA
jgi:hypothetical protein